MAKKHIAIAPFVIVLLLVLVIDRVWIKDVDCDHEQEKSCKQSAIYLIRRSSAA